MQKTTGSPLIFEGAAKFKCNILSTLVAMESKIFEFISGMESMENRLLDQRVLMYSDERIE